MKLAAKYFVASPADVPPAFPGWREPLPAPERRHLHNPFTREPMFKPDGTPFLISTRRPLGPWLERPRCPQLASFSPLDLWPVSSEVVGVLTEALGAPEPSVFEEVLFVPESFGWSLSTLSESGVRALAGVHEAAATVNIWQDALRRNEGEYFDQLVADVSDWVTVVEHLSRLSRAALRAVQRVYLYEGPDPDDVLHFPPDWEIEPGSLE